MFASLTKCDNIIDALKLSEILSRVTGLFILRLEIVSDGLNIEISKGSCVWSICVILVIIYCNIAELQRTTMYFPRNIGLLLFNSLLVLLIYMHRMTTVPRIGLLFASLERTESVMLEMGRNYDYEKIKFSVLTNCVFVSTVTIWSYVFTCYIDMRRYPLPYYTFLQLFFLHVPTVWILMQLRALLEVTMMGLEEINKILERLSIKKSGLYIKNINTQSNESEKKTENETTKYFEDASKMDVITKMWLRLCRVLRLTNATFGPGLLLLITLQYLRLVSNLYYLVEFSKESFDVLDIMFTAHESLIALMTIYYILCTCQKCFRETSRTPRLLHKIINTDISPNLTKWATTFSMQLLHDVPEFSACGMFTLDYSFILSVIGSAATYLVILVQFQNNST